LKIHKLLIAKIDLKKTAFRVADAIRKTNYQEVANEQIKKQMGKGKKNKKLKRQRGGSNYIFSLFISIE
jgi:hypothetical protein